MNRRKYLVTLGSLAAGSSAAMGTGAFTSVSATRSVDVAVAADSNAFLALEAGDSGLVTGTDDGTLEINLDGSAEGAGGSGVNKNALTMIGYVGDPVDLSEANHPNNLWTGGSDEFYNNKLKYAFAIRNQGTQPVKNITLSYELDDSSWVDDTLAPNGYNSQIQSRAALFQPWGYGDGIRSFDSKRPLVAPAPDQPGDTTGEDYDFTGGVYSQKGALKGSYGDKGGKPTRLKPGDELRIGIAIDTRGSETADDQDLSGSLNIRASVEEKVDW